MLVSGDVTGMVGEAPDNCHADVMDGLEEHFLEDETYCYVDEATRSTGATMIVDLSDVGSQAGPLDEAPSPLQLLAFLGVSAGVPPEPSGVPPQRHACDPLILEAPAVGFFEEQEVPPETPRDPLYFMTTALQIRGVSAAAIGNAVFGHFESARPGSVGQVSHTKFCAKVAAVRGHLSCVLQARLYSRPDGGFVVEFRRCSGDGVAFTAAFLEAWAALRRLSPNATLV